MIDVEKLRQLKGRRIYLFWLDEKSGDITDVTSRDDVVQVIRCKDCKYWLPDDEYADCDLHGMYAPIGDANDFCSCAERKEG